jgi:prepilin peptidase CpaA
VSPFGWMSLTLASLAALYDVRTRRVPNWLTLSALAVAPLAHALAACGAQGADGALRAAGSSLLGVVLCGTVPLVLWRCGYVGGGDVKLLAAMGAVLGPTLGLELAFYAFLLASLFIAFRLGWRGRLLHTLGGVLSLLMNPLRPEGQRRAATPELMETFRFAPAACAGALLAALMHGGSL